MSGNEDQTPSHFTIPVIRRTPSESEPALQSVPKRYDTRRAKGQMRVPLRKPIDKMTAEEICQWEEWLLAGGMNPVPIRQDAPPTSRRTPGTPVSAPLSPPRLRQSCNVWTPRSVCLESPSGVRAREAREEPSLRRRNGADNRRTNPPFRQYACR